jgi:hypothetical protein
LKPCFVADFETTTQENDCRVWLWGLYNPVDLDFEYGTTIEEFFEVLQTLPNKSKVYFHNLKFDGEFTFYELFKRNFTHTTERKLNDYEFSTLITHMGVFYSINVKFPNTEITLYDSLKVIPLTVERMSSAFGIPQLKGEIDYKKKRPIGYIPDKEEIEYVKNDVTIVGDSLLYFFDQNLNKMTQASNAFSDYKKIVTPKKFERLFPNLDAIDAELRQSYKGGFTWVNPKFQGKVVGQGVVLDVNSLYPSVMYSIGDKTPLPYGDPILFEGEYKPDKLYNVYIQMIRCNFDLKKDHIPTIALKNSRLGLPTEYVTSSDGKDVTMCLTSVDMELFFKHYDVYNVEYLEGWKFRSSNTLFRDYIDKWVTIKNQATIDGNEGLRTIAKLMLNALYGKFGLNPCIISKIPTWDGEKVNYVRGEKGERESIYLPVASFITAYARRITIEAGQANYKTFIYADTDSLHLNTNVVPDNLDVDAVRLGAWKFEGKYNKGKFLRCKSYIEVMYLYFDEWDKLKPKKKKEWTFNFETGVFEQTHIACAGLPTKLHGKITFDDFKDGMKVAGKLKHHRVKGGVILKEDYFTLKL